MSCEDCTKSNACHFCKAGNREQFQAVIIPSDGSGYQTPEDLPSTTGLISRNAKDDCGDGRRCSWWWITVHPLSIIRTGDPNPEPPPVRVPEQFKPLSEAEIQARGQAASSLKVKLILSDSTWKQRTLIVDVGAGFSIPWYGTAVQLEVLTFAPVLGRGPSGDYPIAKVETSFKGYLGQAVEDVILEANVVPTDGSGYCGSLPLTYTQVIEHEAPLADLEFLRPAGSRRMAWFSTSGTPTATNFSAIPGFALPTVGRVEPSPLQQNTQVGSAIDVPGPARSLVLSNASTGTYTVVWEIQP